MAKMERGITLTELLIAIIIMAVLAGLVIARFTGQSERAVVSEAIGMLSAIRQAEVAYELEHPSTYTTTLSDLDVEVPVAGTSAFNYSINNAGTATATRNAGAQACQGKTVTLTVDGVFGGSHPNGPNPAAGATCT